MKHLIAAQRLFFRERHGKSCKTDDFENFVCTANFSRGVKERFEKETSGRVL